MNVMYCPNCKKVLKQKSDKDYWCKNCARLWKIILMERYIKGKLMHMCPKCRNEIKPQQTFCHNCGYSGN